jgi:putative endopeptidase
MGHEYTHGFDSSGRQFDDSNSYHDWWSASSAEEFHQRSQCLIKQYDTFEALPNLFVNGTLTLPENIADNGGIHIAYQAFNSLAEERRSPDPMPSGYSQVQTFFIAFAQSRCGKLSEAKMRELIAQNPHSPPRFRVQGSLINNHAFSEAFNCAVGSAMNPREKCVVW